jgi:hypothetical protein
MKKNLRNGMLGIMMVMFMAGISWSNAQNGFRVQLLIDGQPVPEYWLRGTPYVEALKGKEYSLQISNPLPVRVAVALAVDGLNTIDARHTDPRSAHKWVLEPYQTIEIKGWQTNSSSARKFFFTSEEQSYGAWLGKTQNLGVISAVFFKEKQFVQPCNAEASKGEARGGVPAVPAPSAQMSHAGALDSKRDAAKSKESQEEYAATGIGDRINHAVERIHLDLESTPCANLSIRYEFHPGLARLGLIPNPPVPDPLQRRQQAHGFDGMGWCPEPR